LRAKVILLFKVQIKKKIFLYFLDEKFSMSYDLEESS